MERIVYSILFMILLTTLFYVSKSDVFFNNDGRLKHFGINGNTNNETLFSFGSVVVIMSLFSVFLFTILDFLMKKK